MQDKGFGIRVLYHGAWGFAASSVLSLEEAHFRLSKMSAASIGLEHLGTLERGLPADIMVYDQAALKVTPDRPYFDPIIGGGKRLIEKSEGYRYMIVNGVVTFVDGVCTGALPGRVLRTPAWQADGVTQGDAQ